MTRPVRLLFFTQTLDCETCLQTRQILDELPPLSDRITIEEVNFVLEPEKAKQYGIDRVPAIAVVGQDEAGAERDSKIRFLGTPAGYEFISLIQRDPARRRRAVDAVGGEPRARRRGRRADDDARVHDADLPALPARGERWRTRWRWRTRTSPPTPSKRPSSRISPAATT